MKTKKTNYLDERQEQKLLQIESKGFWLLFWLLLIALFAQIAIDMIDAVNVSIPPFAGEWVVFMIAAIYVSVACLKNNIWARSIKPNTKTNVVASLIAGCVVGIIFGVISFINFGKPIGSVCTALITACFTGGLCLVLLSASASVLKKRTAVAEDDDCADTADA